MKFEEFSNLLSIVAKRLNEDPNSKAEQPLTKVVNLDVGQEYDEHRDAEAVMETIRSTVLSDFVEYPLFTDYVRQIYSFTDTKIKKNKDGNFFWKGLYCYVLVVLVPLNLFFSALLTGILKMSEVPFPVVYNQGYQFITAHLLIYLIGLFIPFVICFGIKKWVDIKKFQETWSRHRNNRSAMDVEFLKYNCALDPYQYQETKKEKFIANIVEILASNTSKFETNMETKEIQLTDNIAEILNALTTLKP